MIKGVYRILPVVVLSLLLDGCNKNELQGNRTIGETALFELLPAERTNVNFVNQIEEGLNTNVLMYEYFYNGAGVAAGDLNNDGWEDLVFTSNFGNNTLFLNQGDFNFKEVGALAGMSGRPGPWKTGVTMADVNGDGLLDLYVCYSGKLSPEKLVNQLFINMGAASDGVPRFTDQTVRYGLAIPNNTTHAVFFDFDNDGDLDLFILNHHPDSLPKLNEEDTENVLQIDDPVHGVRLMRNDNGYFTDITLAAGIISSPITYGLGAGVADINLDGYTDIYICNDFSLPDYLYINNGDGTFTDKLPEMMRHTSYASMGNNVADINNDGLPDVFSLDMLPEDNRRQKLLLAPNDYDFFDLNVRLGFNHQYLRSMLHLNNGNGTFSEIGQIAGIAATDWSWSPLFADFDNDGWKDLLITNGYLRDYTNLDFLHMMDLYVTQNTDMKRADVLNLVNQMPETELYNYIYRNNRDATFSRRNSEWGLKEGSYSNGAVYADLDNDGDLDIVTNNINKQAFIYRNSSADKGLGGYLKIKLKGNRKNRFGFGARVYVFSGGNRQLLEQQPARGYQSSVSPILHFGLGNAQSVDSVMVIWQGGKKEVKRNLGKNQLIEFVEEQALSIHTPAELPVPIYAESSLKPAYRHQQPEINDFKRQPLMFNAKSFEGPAMASADVNGDGTEDVYIGGGKGQPGALFLRTASGFSGIEVAAFSKDRAHDDVEAVFFDANADGAPDLYVGSGGYHDFMADDPLLKDRLYLNDGKGNFGPTNNSLPTLAGSTGVVAVCDLDDDGDIDLFRGGFVMPGRYPEAPQSALLLNDGKGNFSDVTGELAPGLERIGMVSDATWADLDGDGKKELVLAGLWMPIKVFGHSEGKWVDVTGHYFDRDYSGFWNTMEIRDLNNDGKPDIIAGNLGENSQMQVKSNEPADLYFKDFDNNGTIDPVICFYIQGKSYPYMTRKELISQLPRMEQRFPTFESYADASINEVFTEAEMTGVMHLQAKHAKTTLFMMDQNGRYTERELPLEAQYSPVYTITAIDFNTDGNMDLLLCGNLNHARIRFGKYDANYGLLLLGDGKGGFEAIPQYRSGFDLVGDVRQVLSMEDVLLFGINGSAVRSFQLN